MPSSQPSSRRTPAVGRLLVDLAETVARTLGLGAADVIAVHTPSGASAASGSDAVTPVSAWHIVSIHGSDRLERREDGCGGRAAEVSVRAWCQSAGVACEGVWTQWLTPIPS